MAVTDCHGAQYDVEARRRRFYRAAYWLRDPERGRFAFCLDADHEPVIPQHRREDDSRYAHRRSLALVAPVTRHIVDHYVSHVFRQQARVGFSDGATPEAFTRLLTNCDGWGTSLAATMRKACRTAFLEQSSGILVDRDAEGSPVLRQISPDAILDADLMPDGSVSSALVLIDTVSGPAVLSVTRETVQRAYIVNDRISNLYPAVDHGMPGCPLVMLTGTPPIAPSVASYQQRLIMLDSLLITELEENAVTWYQGRGIPEPEAMPRLVKSPTAIVAFASSDAKIEPITGSPEPVIALEKRISATRAEMYEVAKVQPVQPVGAPESGVARAYRFVDADVELATIADVVEEAENRALRLWAAACGISDPPQADYPDSFIPPDEDAAITRALAVEASTLPEAFKGRERRRLAGLLYPGDTDLIEEMDGDAVGGT